MKPPKRCKTMFAGRGGWSEWVYPTARYWMQCCDCGLVHEMQFGTFVAEKRGRGTFEVHPLPYPIRPMFRARRARKRK